MQSVRIRGSTIQRLVAQVGPAGTTRPSSRASKRPLSGFPFTHSDLCEPICFAKETDKASAIAQFADLEGLAGQEIFKRIEAARQLEPS